MSKLRIEPDRRLFYVFRIFLLAGLLTLNLWITESGFCQTGFGSAIDPDQYIIKPGDKFRIDFWDGAVSTINITVTPEGTILLSDMGRLDVSGLTLSSAQDKIGTLVKEYYPDSDISVSLDGLRSVSMFVTGGVKNPGFYNGTVADRVSKFINKAGGLIPGASHRNIILADNGNEKIIDLLRFERAGDFKVNPYVYSGEIIKVPMIVDSSAFIQISGAVSRTEGFEFSPGDNLGILIDLAYGLNGLEGDSAVVFRKTESGDRKTMIGLNNKDYSLSPSDKVIIMKRDIDDAHDYYTVTGEVNLCGRFPYSESINLKTVLEISGGLTLESDIYSLIIFRRPEFRDIGIANKNIPAKISNNINVAMGVFPVSLEIDEYYPERLDEIKILPGDSIVIPVLTGTIGVLGYVKRPGVVDYEYPMTIANAIKMAGGFAPDADKNTIQVVRKVGGLNLKAAMSSKICDGDMIVIAEKTKRKSFLDKAKDWAIILGGLGALYLAIDNVTE